MRPCTHACALMCCQCMLRASRVRALHRGAWLGANNRRCPLPQVPPSPPLRLLGAAILDICPALLPLASASVRASGLLLPCLMRAAAAAARPREMLTAVLEALGTQARCVAGVRRHAATCSTRQLHGRLPCLSLHATPAPCSDCFDSPKHLLLLSLLPLLPPLLARLPRRKAACALEALGPIEVLAQAAGDRLADTGEAAELVLGQHGGDSVGGTPQGAGAAALGASGTGALELAGRVVLEPFVAAVEGIWAAAVQPEVAAAAADQQLPAHAPRAAHAPAASMSGAFAASCLRMLWWLGGGLPSSMLRDGGGEGHMVRLAQLAAVAAVGGCSQADVSPALGSVGTTSSAVSWQQLLATGALQAHDGAADEDDEQEGCGGSEGGCATSSSHGAEEGINAAEAGAALAVLASLLPCHPTAPSAAQQHPPAQLPGPTCGTKGRTLAERLAPPNCPLEHVKVC